MEACKFCEEKMQLRQKLQNFWCDQFEQIPNVHYWKTYFFENDNEFLWNKLLTKFT